jgi:hypothetical protein
MRAFEVLPSVTSRALLLSQIQEEEGLFCIAKISAQSKSVAKVGLAVNP